MAQVVTYGYGSNKIYIQPQGLRYGCRHRSNVEMMFNPRANVIVLGRNEDLGLVAQSPKWSGVDNTCVIALEVCSERALPRAMFTKGCFRRKIRALSRLNFFSGTRWGCHYAIPPPLSYY
jgi:hypothetical protein